MAQLYKITCIINNKSYIGIVWQKNKTYLDRFEEHISGKKGCGKFLHIAIKEFGREFFVPVLLEEGNIDHIRQREIEESINHLFSKDLGYNGNSGYAIYNDINTQKIINEKLNIKRANSVLKAKKTFKINKEKNGKTRKRTIENIKNTNPEKWKLWKCKQANSIKNQTKDTHEWRRKQSESLRLRATNPSDKMIEGNIKRSKSHTGKKGIKASAFKGWYHTPIGAFASMKTCTEYTKMNDRLIPRLCYNNILITKKLETAINKLDVFNDIKCFGKYTKDIGFYFIPKY